MKKYQEYTCGGEFISQKSRWKQGSSHSEYRRGKSKCDESSLCKTLEFVLVQLRVNYHVPYHYFYVIATCDLNLRAH